MNISPILSKQTITESDFLSLISPEALPQIELLAQKANRITESRFGKRIQLYVPLYLSNVCLNDCSYCGFRVTNKYEKVRLSFEDAVKEAKQLYEYGFRHILLVAGEDRKYITPEFLANLAKTLREFFPSISIEVEPFDVEGYQTVIEAGIEGLVSYQETYQRDVYDKVHISGKKCDYDYRYETANRAATAGMRRIGVGFLVGLADWRQDALMLFRHLRLLLKHHWQVDFTVSFPRLRYAEGADIEMFEGFEPKHAVSDKEYVQLITAFRIAFPDTGIVLSTREKETLRNNLIPLGVTMMSAGSKTEPGGYTSEKKSGKQFEVEDTRSPFEVAESISAVGYEPVWKDWDVSMK